MIYRYGTFSRTHTNIPNVNASVAVSSDDCSNLLDLMIEDNVRKRPFLKYTTFGDRVLSCPELQTKKILIPPLPVWDDCESVYLILWNPYRQPRNNLQRQRYNKFSEKPNKMCKKIRLCPIFSFFCT